jgi:signal transduction histidine kinase
MQLNLRNRITLYYLVTTGVLIGLFFAIIYLTVKETAYRHIDEDLKAESNEIEKNLVILNDRFIIANTFEWNEKEHGQIEVNPIFMQIIDTSGGLIKKTGNLLNGKLKFEQNQNGEIYFDTFLSGSPVRQIQLPVKNPVGVTLGYIIVAMPLEESAVVLQNLFLILFGAYWIVLFVLYYVTRFIADKSILPINKVIATAERITKENLDERIDLPVHKDEIYKLTSTINDLLNRLEDAVLREKQFTSDASHELRTPLAVIKGTLEVLIRKPRQVDEYEGKIKYCIGEVDRMSALIDQLLMLARYESGKVTPMISEVALNSSIKSVLFRMQKFIDDKKLSIKYDNAYDKLVQVDSSMIEIILENILSNAIKYSQEGKDIEIKIYCLEGKTICSIRDYGIGMTPEQTSKIFDRFYRGDKSRIFRIDGNGIGLAIVKKLADLQNIALSVSSTMDKGTVFTISFPA